MEIYSFDKFIDLFYSEIINHLLYTMKLTLNYFKKYDLVVNGNMLIR